MNTRRNFLGMKVLVVVAVVLVFFIIFGFTYANLSKEAFHAFRGEVMKIDERGYSTYNLENFDIVLEPIMDRDIFKKQDHVIYFSFLVGGSKENTIDDIIYDISLKELEVDCSLLSPYVKWVLFKNKIEISRGSLDYRFDTIQDGRLVLTNIQQNLVKYNKNKIGYDNYSFYLWLSDSCQEEDILKCQDKDDQLEIMGKRLRGKIEVELYATKKKSFVRRPKNKLDSNTCLHENGEVK